LQVCITPRAAVGSSRKPSQRPRTSGDPDQALLVERGSFQSGRGKWQV
jgi:hypothetical protein